MENYIFCAVDKTNEYTEKPSRYECSFEKYFMQKGIGFVGNSGIKDFIWVRESFV